LPFDQLEEISDLILNFLSARELVDVDKKQVNSVISVGQDDEDNERNAQQPSDDGTFEKGVFHNLGEYKHNSSPKIKSMKSRPNFSNNFIVIRRAKVESHKQDEGADQDQSQQKDLELIASQESETNDHQSLVDNHEEIDSCADSKIRGG